MYIIQRGGDVSDLNLESEFFESGSDSVTGRLKSPQYYYGIIWILFKSFPMRFLSRSPYLINTLNPVDLRHNRD